MTITTTMKTSNNNPDILPTTFTEAASLLSGNDNKTNNNNQRQNNNNTIGSYQTMEGGKKPVAVATTTTTSSDNWILQHSMNNNNNNNSFDLDDDDDNDDGLEEQQHETTFSQTVIHLVKGYIGCGILSLPWAISQLGIVIGILSIIFMTLWSSYNCWTVVKLKRYIERTEMNNLNFRNTVTAAAAVGGITTVDVQSDDGASNVPSVATSSSNLTYPGVGEWAHGSMFQKYISACVCIQQLAIGTVFMSFVGENVFAILQFLDVQGLLRLLHNHQAVITAILPIMIALSVLPSLKSLAPVMLAGTICIIGGLASLGVIGVLEWQHQQQDDWRDVVELPQLNLFKAPMALCSILYSLEGICIILPTESAMKEPKQFQTAFGWSMIIVTILLCAVASLSVFVFGNVTSGSINAFLLEKYKDTEEMKFWLITSNLLVSVSIILTYPLQLFPAIELIAPMLQDFFHNHRRKHWKSCFNNNNNVVGRICGCCFNNNKGEGENDDNDSNNSEHDLEGFEPMAEIPEDEIASLGSVSFPSQSQYYDDDDYGFDGKNNAGSSKPNGYDEEGNDEKKDKEAVVDNVVSLSRVSSTMGYRSVVGADCFPVWQVPGDSLALRVTLVLSTYCVAIVVPNVESLVSLAGAVAGSSTALLIPPILELAWIRHMEKKEDIIYRTQPDWIVGGPSSYSPLQPSPRPPRRQPLPTTNSKQRQNGKKAFWRRQKIISWCLLVMGMIFAAIGSYFSIQDIVTAYTNSGEE